MKKCGPPIVNKCYFKNKGVVISPNSPFVFSSGCTTIRQVGENCQYATISLALADANAGDTIIVSPGTYTETLTIPANNITIIGNGSYHSVVVQQADANVVNCSTYTGCDIYNIKFQVTAATTAINTIQVSTGYLHLLNCEVKMTSSAALVQSAQPKCGACTGSGELRLENTEFVYAHTGACGGTAQKAAFSVGNSGLVRLENCVESTITNSGSALVSSIGIDLASSGAFQILGCEVQITEDTATLTAGLAYLAGTGLTHEFWRNRLEINATGVTNAYGFYATDTATTSRFFYNHIHVENATNNYSFLVGSSATVVSHFDDLVTTDGKTGSGTLKQVTSESDGNLTLTGGIKGGHWYSLDEDSDWDDQPASSSTITMNNDLTSIIKVGMPIKFTLGGSATNPGTYYAICTAIASNLLTIAGAPLETDDGDLTALSIDLNRDPIQVDLFVASTYADGTDTTLLASDMKNYFKWGGKKAYLVAFGGTQNTVDSGTEPKINVMVNSAAVSTNDSNNGIQLSTQGTWVDNSAVAISTSNYDINRGEAVELNCTVAGGTGDAANLSVTCVFVTE